MKVGSETQINSQTSGNQGSSSISANAAGQAVVVWDSAGQDGSGLGVYAQRLSLAEMATYQATYIEEGGAVNIADSDATVLDIDSTDLVSLTVTITNLLDGDNESLSFNTSGTSITGSYSSGTGVLTLSGNDTMAHYQQVLRTIQYSNTSDAPTTAARILNVMASDGSLSSTVAVSTIQVVATNDAPVFSDGSPAPSDDGIVTTDIASAPDNVFGMTVQSDGKILVAGQSGTGINSDFALLRYHANGSLDSSFGTGGVVITDIAAAADVGFDVTVQLDGKILVSGQTFNGTDYDFAILRYNSDGSLDTGFGTGGIVTTDFGGLNDVGKGITLQTDGKILVTGASFNGADYDFALARYNSDGSLDGSFGTGGLVTTGIGPGDDQAVDVAVQTDGKILVSGESFNGANSDFALVRYNANGSLDASFGAGGKVTTDFGLNVDKGVRFALQPDGKILLAGQSHNGIDYDFALARYNNDGSLDTGFGTGGKVSTSLGMGNDLAYNVAVQTDGKIVVSGDSNNGIDDDFAVVRYHSDGTLDASFGTGGQVTTAVGAGTDKARAFALQPDGQILLAGFSHNGTDNDIAVVRYNSDGSLDTTFDATNTLDGNPTFVEGGAAVVLDTDVHVFDVELNAADDYDGATLTISRNGGANTDDQFSAAGNLVFSAGNLVLAGVTVGTVDNNSGGTLQLTFNSNATQARINETLQSIAYSNSSDAPPASVQLDWTFNDGNTGAQGTGGALDAVGSTVVQITAVNDAPVNIASGPLTAVEETPTAFAGLSINDVDAGVGLLTTRLVVSNGILNVTLAGSASISAGANDSGDLTIEGTVADINATLATLNYTGNTDVSGTAADTLTMITNDGGNTGTGGPHMVVNFVQIDITPVNDSPVITSDGGGATASVLVNENSTGVTTVVATDADLPAQTLTFSIVGGADAAAFDVDSSTGVLTFISAPDFENPADFGADNTYDVVVQVSDGNLGMDTQSIAVTVTNVADGIRVTPISVVPIGGETLVNTNIVDNQTINPNVAQAIATDANGNYVVVWTSNLQDGSLYGIYAQRFNAQGIAQGAEFLINTTTADNQINPAVAMDTAGNFVVTWSSNLQDGDGYGVYAQRFDAAGVSQGSEFQVHTTTVGGQGTPAIAMANDGRFVIAWSSGGQDPDGSTGIYAQRFDASGVAQGSEFRVNTYTTGIQQLTSVAMDSAGNFVVTWASDLQDGSNYGVYGQRYDANGVALGSEFRVNTTTTDSQLYHDVAMLKDGRFVVAYQSRSGSNYEVYVQRYAADGTAIGGELRVNTATVTGNQPIPSVTADESGNITVVWNSSADGNGAGVIGRRLDWSGNMLGGEFQVNTTTTGNQLYPEVVAQPDGRFIVAWSGNGPGDADGVFMQRYGLATTETGGTATFQIVLEAAPTSDVTIAISVSSGSEASVSAGSVTFTNLDWNVPKVITITGLQDYINDGDQVYQIVLGPAASSDSNFNGLDAEDLTVINLEVPNTTPVNSVPGDQSVNEDTDLGVLR